MLKIGIATMVYDRGEWTLEVDEATDHHLARSETKTRTENHGSFFRALPAVARYLQTEQDKKRYDLLYQLSVAACNLFKKTATYPFTEKVEYTVPALQGDHHCITRKNHGGVLLTRSIRSDHKRSITGVVTLQDVPGNHYQACKSMLSTDIGEKLLDSPDMSFNDTALYMKERIETIFRAVKDAKPVDYDTRGADDEQDDSDQVLEATSEAE